jgi:hypothetical protein
MRLLTDPAIFNYVIMTLYGVNAIRWLCAGKCADAIYWTGALIITSAVTFGYKH